ncbi:MAG: mannose-6-phosphate isomerase, class I [Acidimicrobiales bacterium]|nr:mannose-6-phosphate isomerase, class I [Acidimicrobiales bacterium]
MDRLRCPIQPYAWGSRTAIPELMGEIPSGEPAAELWMGAHHRGAAQLERAGETLSLGAAIAIDPQGELGGAAARRFGGCLPYLMKVLAAAEPLSLQAHPSSAQAEVGFAREELAGVPIDAPDRSFRDANHKPELICALTPFAALCGFADAEDSIPRLRGLGQPELQPVIDHLVASPDADGVAAALQYLLTLDRGPAEQLVTAVVAATTEADVPAGIEAWVQRLAGKYPGDPGVAVALLMNLVTLAPGQALFLGAGNLHAYLDGVGIEIMASSDNVLRGGLTQKHIAIDDLLEVVDCSPFDVPIQTAVGPVHTFEAPIDEFALTRVVPEQTIARPLHSGEIVLSLHGTTEIKAPSARPPQERVELGPGQVVWVPASHGHYRLTTDEHAVAFIASVPAGS